MENILVIVNKKSGRQQTILYKKKLKQFLKDKKLNFSFVEIADLDFKTIPNYNILIVMGGDGTINQILPFVKEQKILIIPAGTANLLSAKLGILNFNNSLKAFCSNKTKDVNIFKINNKLSILRLGFGYDSDIICKTPQSIKNKFGYFAYFVAGIIFALRLKLKEYVLSFDNSKQKVKASCIVIGNCSNMFKNYFTLANNQKLDDDIFEIFILKTENPILFFFELIKIFFNYKVDSSIASYLKANKLEIVSDYSVCHIDGEKTKFMENISCEFIENKIKFYCI